METPASPRGRRLASPSWLDARFVIGLLMVLISIVVGSRVLAGADRSDRIYAVTRDLAAGTALTDGDLRVVRVRLLDGRAGYISAAGPKPVGYVVARPVGANEFLPRQALRSASSAEVRLVSVPVDARHYPAGLSHGDLVDLYHSAKPIAGREAAPPTLVISAVPVDAVFGASTGRLAAATDAGVVLRVPVAEVSRVVAAAQNGALDVVRIPASAPVGPASAGAPVQP